MGGAYFKRRLRADVHKKNIVSLQHVFEHLLAGKSPDGWSEGIKPAIYNSFLWVFTLNEDSGKKKRSTFREVKLLISILMAPSSGGFLKNKK